MFNNLIFILHAVTITIMTIIASHLGKQFSISTMAIFGILANLFVLKQINLYGLQVTSADVFIVGISLGLNLLQAKYNQATAQKAVWVSFWSLLTYTVLSQFQIWYIPNELDCTHTFFTSLLSLTPRLTIASLCSYLISQTLDVKLYAYFQKNLQNKFGLITNYLSIIISQLADTVIFSIIGLYGLNYNLLHIIIFSYLIKLAAITISIITLAALKKLIKI